MADLQRADNIMKNAEFMKVVRQIEEAETDRVYCRHGLAHLMDVARIGAVIVREKDLDIRMDMIYAAALVHDLGRAAEYADGTPHAQGSVILARRILPECGYSDSEVSEIVRAVSAHSLDGNQRSDLPLADVLFEADKKSRLCFMCDAAGTCKWSDEKKNMELQY